MRRLSFKGGLGAEGPGVDLESKQRPEPKVFSYDNLLQDFGLVHFRHALER